MIEFKNVFIQYVNDFYSLYNFSCEISSHTLFVGDFFNGTTTIMRTLAKIDKNYKGKIFIDNVDLKNTKDKDLNLVYLPENPVLFKNNIFNNLYFPLKIRKINKNVAKNLIYSIFTKLKDNNFDIFYNYFNLNKKNEKLKTNDLINKILKLKIKKLNLSEQKILTLIRALLKKPKYVLLENFFENLEKDYIPLAKYLINQLKECSTIIACEKEIIEVFEDFQINNLTIKKKED